MVKTASVDHPVSCFAAVLAALAIVFSLAFCVGCSSDNKDSGNSTDAKSEQKESGDPVADDRAMVEANAGKDVSNLDSDSEKSAPLTEDEKSAALEDAETLFRVHYASYNGLIYYLSDHGHSEAAAQYAADNCNADWNQEAVKCAQYYLKAMSMDREELLGQLEYEGFASSQAEYAANAVGL